MRSIVHRILALAMGSSLAGAVVLGDSSAPKPSAVPSTRPASIPWNQAKDHIGEEAIVTGPVVGTHDFRGAAVLNIGKDYPSPARFTVYIPADKRKGMPADLDIGKTISISGKLKLFHNVPEIEGDAGNITIVEQSTTGPATKP